MAISKRERTLSIWIGIAIGVACSSMLFRYALEEKEERSSNRPGNYDSLLTASEGKPFAPLPEAVTSIIPNGIVIYFDRNDSVSLVPPVTSSMKWVIETAGSFRSERLFILVEKNPNPSVYDCYRASELYLALVPGVSEQRLEEALDEDRFRIIGRNEATRECIVQIKDFSPAGIRSSLRELSEVEGLVEGVRLSPWKPRT